MNSRRINGFCLRNDIRLYYCQSEDNFKVFQGSTILYVSNSYDDCINYITELLVNDKHTTHR